MNGKYIVNIGAPKTSSVLYRPALQAMVVGLEFEEGETAAVRCFPPLFS